MRTTALILTLALLSITANAAADSSSAGNSVFRIIVENTPGADGIGVFTILTGPNHPAGNGHEVLFAGGSHDDAASSYLTVRSYTTGTDYVQTTSGAASGNLVSVLDPYGSVEPMGSTGFRTTYTLPGTAAAPDRLRIVSEIDVAGTTIEDSVVTLKTTLRNEDTVPLLLGVRYLLDFANGGDDGPAWREAGSVPQIVEGTAGVNPKPMTLAPTAPDAAPVATSLAISYPSAATFAALAYAFPFAFDYTPAGRDIAGPCALNDAAVLTYVGRSRESAISLAPAESGTVSVTIANGDASGFPVDGPTSCATPPPKSTPVPGGPTPVPQPVELPRTGGMRYPQ